MEEKKIKKPKIKQKNKLTKGNSFKTPEVIFLVLITCLISFVMGMNINKKTNPSIEQNSINDAELTEFIKNYRYILENYYDDVDKKTLLDGATEGMIQKLGDEFSTVISDEDTNNFNIQLEGTYEGIGIEVINDENKNIVIYNVISDSPAEKAGLKSGDIILTVNDQDFIHKDSSKLSEYIQNANTKKFKIRIKRGTTEKEYRLEKKRITLKSVTSEYIEKDQKKIGYIYISLFANETYNQFKKELKKLEDKKIDTLILDVRDNTGGHLTTVAKMLSLFLDKSHVIYQTQTKNNTKKFYSDGNQTKQYKIIVLQNENSASASELLSASLKEEYHATIIGTTSYGKGTVQELIETGSGKEYKFTTKKWLTPKGNWIHQKGVEPTIKIELSEEYKKNPKKENDNQYNKAIEEAIK